MLHVWRRPTMEAEQMTWRRVKLAADKPRALLSNDRLNPHGVARTRESLAILACHRSENKLSEVFPLAATCSTSRICQFWTILRICQGIPLGSFMRLHENIDPIEIKSPGSRKRRRSSIRRGDSGGYGSGVWRYDS
jgi:hypothetical protein